MNILRKDYTTLYYTNPLTREVWEMTNQPYTYEMQEPEGGMSYTITEVQYKFKKVQRMPDTGIMMQPSYLEELLINRHMTTNGRYPVCAYRTDSRKSYEEYEWPTDPYLEARDFVLESAYMDSSIYSYNFYHTANVEQMYAITSDPDLQNIFQRDIKMRGRNSKRRVWQKDHADFRDFAFRLGSLFSDFVSYYELTAEGYAQFTG